MSLGKLTLMPIRLETLRNVNDALVNEIAELDIFPLWDIIPNKRLSDADGQKFETRLETIQSRHSSNFRSGKRNSSIHISYKLCSYK